MKYFICCFLLFFSINSAIGQKKSLRVGVVGLTHTHVHWILGRENKGDITIVGIVEPNHDLALRYSKQHGFSMNIVHDNLKDMLLAAQPEAVTAYGTIQEHLGIVETCAPKGIHVMVEKPLATTLEDAKKMELLAKSNNIQLLTNYETTWYPTNHKAFSLVRNDSIGKLKKVVIRDGHKGPKKIGVNSEFLDWLIDPEKNGGGALMDFGCYGANLMTWLKQGQKPKSVTAVVQQLQKENNPLVDDEAIIILNYKDSNAIIQASWNWPIGRKDMEIYGELGAIYADNSSDLRVRISEGYDGYQEERYQLQPLPTPKGNPFSYFAKIIQGEITPEPYALSSLENNMIVMEILEAAKKSSETNKTIKLH